MSRPRAVAAAVVAAVLVSACAPSPNPSAVPTLDRVADLIVRVELAPVPPPPISGREVHARLVAADGRAVDEWVMAERGGGRQVPAGTFRLDLWTVVFSDALACGPDPVSGLESCGPSSSGMGQVCSAELAIDPGDVLELRFQVLAAERCNIAG
jgi:hypothetical protein